VLAVEKRRRAAAVQNAKRLPAAHECREASWSAPVLWRFGVVRANGGRFEMDKRRWRAQGRARERNQQRRKAGDRQFTVHLYFKQIMVDAIKTLYDLLAEFLRERARGKQELFENYTTPLYEGAKKVFDDYLMVFADMKKMAKDGKSLRQLSEFINERRHTTLSTRHQLRAFIQEFGSHTPTGSLELPPFERSILGILEGAFEVAHSLGHFRARLEEQMTHEELCEKEKRAKPSRTAFLKRFAEELDAQMRFMESEFKTVADEYAAMQAKQTKGRPTRRKKR
jgi:hypothetical protein